MLPEDEEDYGAEELAVAAESETYEEQAQMETAAEADLGTEADSATADEASAEEMTAEEATEEGAR